jgi:hypothetical protein
MKSTLPTEMSRILTLASGSITNPARDDSTTTGIEAEKPPSNNVATMATVDAIATTVATPAQARTT